MTTREQKARPALESIVDEMQKVLEQVCKEVNKQAKLYQESVRDQVRAYGWEGGHVMRKGTWPVVTLLGSNMATLPTRLVTYPSTCLPVPSILSKSSANLTPP